VFEVVVVVVQALQVTVEFLIILVEQVIVSNRKEEQITQLQEDFESS
jgi:hypothetical protein